MSVPEACDYHAEQIDTFAETCVDLVSAFTMNYLGEAIGVTLAAAPPVCRRDLVHAGNRRQAAEWHSLQEAIEQTDAATTVIPSTT